MVTRRARKISDFRFQISDFVFHFDLLFEEEINMQISIYAKYLGLIAAGQKTMEGRLCTSLWRNMHVGQTVTFFDRKSAQSVDVEVENIYQHPDFEDMLRSHGVQQFLPDRRQDDVWGAVSVYHSFPDYQQRVKDLGACAIGFKLKTTETPEGEEDKTTKKRSKRSKRREQKKKMRAN